MSIERSTARMTAPSHPAAPPRSNRQSRASALIDALAVRSNWQTLIAEARALWPAVHAEEMAKVMGDFHVLAGLVQLRQHLSREESDQQVRAFFARQTPPS